MEERGLRAAAGIRSWRAISVAGGTRAELEAATFGEGPRPAHDTRFAGTPLASIPVASIPRPIADALPRAGGYSNLVWRSALHVLRGVLRDAAEDGLGAVPEPARTALVVTSTKVHIDALLEYVEGRGRADSPPGGPTRTSPEVRHLYLHLLARDLAREAGLGGPVSSLSVACASGLSAIGRGADLLARGDCDAVAVVGVDILSRFVAEGFHALQAVDPAGCRPFDAQRAGITPGEAAAAVLLCRAEGASARTRVTGFGSSNDANHLTGPSRDGSGLALAIRRALEAARLAPGDIDFIHAHATATLFNDAMESKAYASVFGDNVPPVTASKGMLGHTFGASGVIETCQCDLILGRGAIPPVAGLQVRADDAPHSVVAAEVRPSRLMRCLKVGAGFGGVNAAIVLEGGAP